MVTVLPVEAFLVLAALSWADDTIRPFERAGLLRAARECGVPDGEMERIEDALATKCALADVEPGPMTEWQRIVTYALGCWIARLDGVLSTDERESLEALAKRLELARPLCERASVAAFDISVLPEGGRPEKFDFVKLEARLREKLPGQAKNAT